MGIEKNNASEAQDCLSSSDAVQNDQRSARNPMVIAGMPEDRSKTFKNLQKQTKTFKAIYTCTCTPVGPTAIIQQNMKLTC
eukprot:11020151-Heterocapsa_arctica.AAC.1